MNKLDLILKKHGEMWRTLKTGMCSNEAKQAILKLMREMIPARKKALEDNKMTQWTRDGFNLCRDVMLDNLKKME